MKRKKICIVTAGVLPVPDTKGGAIERLMTMIAEDNEKYYRLELTIVSCYESRAEKLQQNFKHTEFINIKCKQPSPFLYKWGNVKLRWHIRKWFKYDIHWFVPYLYKLDRFFEKKREYDLIVAEGVDYEAMYSATKIYGKNKICCHLHMNPPASENRDKIYGKTVAVSDYIINSFRNVSQCQLENTATIFNGIDTNTFDKQISLLERDKIRETLGINKDDFVVLFCGRIVKVKGVKELIQAVCMIKIPQVKLLIVGSSNFGNGDKGDYSKEVKQLVQNNRERIKFTGFVNNKELYKYHQISDVGVVPSVYQDPCPLSMFEMITSGLPTIATKAGGMVEIGNEKCTLFVRIENIVSDLAEAILELYRNESKRKQMSKEAKIRCKEFTRERFYNDFCDTLISMSD